MQLLTSFGKNTQSYLLMVSILFSCNRLSGMEQVLNVDNEVDAHIIEQRVAELVEILNAVEAQDNAELLNVALYERALEHLFPLNLSLKQIRHIFRIFLAQERLIQRENVGGVYTRIRNFIRADRIRQIGLLDGDLKNRFPENLSAVQIREILKNRAAHETYVGIRDGIIEQRDALIWELEEDQQLESEVKKLKKQAEWQQKSTAAKAGHYAVEGAKTAAMTSLVILGGLASATIFFLFDRTLQLLISESRL